MNIKDISRQISQVQAKAPAHNRAALNGDLAKLNKLAANAKRMGKQQMVAKQLEHAFKTVNAYMAAEKVKGNYAAARANAHRIAKPKSSGCASTTAVALVSMTLVAYVFRRRSR